jgi:DNA-binding transcriptional LysR family regulator
MAAHAVPMTRQSRAASTTSRVTVLSWLSSLIRVKEVVNLGHGFTLLPRSHVGKELAAGALAIVAVPEFIEDPLIYCLAVLKSRSLSPAAKVFRDAVLGSCNYEPRLAAGSFR